MSKQIALFTLTSVTYSGANLGANFTVDITGDTEHTQLPMQLIPGGTTNLSLNAGGVEHDFTLGPRNFTMAVTVSGNNLGAPINGGNTIMFVVNPVPAEQLFSQTVVISSPVAGSATLLFKYRCRLREYPVSYNPEWLCRNRYNWSAFHRWLCLGSEQISDFYTRPEVTALHQVMLDYTAPLQRLSNEQSLGFSPAGNGFFDSQNFTFDVVLGAAPKIDALDWGRRFMLDDFIEAVEGGVEDYMVAVHPLLDPQVMDLCRRWRELLDCFCRYCRQVTVLPAAATSYYDTQIAPHIDALYAQISTAAASEGMPASIAPSSPSINCDKLRYIVSFWAWWCRRCGVTPTFMPTWAPPLEPIYITLYDKRQFLNDILEANNWKLCNPPEKNFCTRWLDALNCLKKLCLNKAYLSNALTTDMENTFGTFIRNLVTFMKLPGVSGLMGPGLDNTCQLLDKIKAYFDKLCPQGAVPAPKIRRDEFDNRLVALEAAITAFKGRNGDLCASSVPITGCDNWMPPLNCLDHLCTTKHLLTSTLRQSILTRFDTVVNDLLSIAFNPPPTPPTGTTGIDLLCFRLGYVRSFFFNLCPSGSLDPIIKLRLEAKLAALQSAHNGLMAEFGGICDSSATIPPSWCTPWVPIIECLQRLCRRSSTLNSDVRDAVAEEFGGVIDTLVWIMGGGATAYSAGTLSFDEICEQLDALLAYLTSLCDGGTIDPVLKLRLEEELDRFQAAYDTLIGDYPGICAEPDDFCEEWVEVLDCLARILDRSIADPGDQRAANAVTMIEDRVTGIIEDTYESVFAQSAPGWYATPAEKLAFETHELLDWFVERCACCGGSIGVSLRDGLAELQELLSSEYSELVDCDPDCQTTSLDITTGTAPWVVTRIDNVQLSQPRTPNDVTGTGGLATPVSGSKWISPHETAADDVIGWTTFQRCFCVCTGGTIRIQFEYWVDDYGDIYLDDTLIYHPTIISMSAPVALDLTRTVAAGRHCLRVEAHNQPRVNMAFCGKGTITPGTATLLDDECCGDSEHPIGLCSDVRTPCDRMTRLIRLYQFLCCPSRASNDPFFETEEYDAMMTALLCFENDILQILYALGDLPEDYPITSESFCPRMRRAMRVMLHAYFHFGRLPALLRWKMECFYNLLRDKVAALAIAGYDAPLACEDTCGVCTRWMDLLDCLCKLCAMRPELQVGHPAIAAQINTLLCYSESLSPSVIGEPLAMAAVPVAGGACCDRLEYIVREVAERCFCCTESPSQIAELETSYAWLSAGYAPIASALATAGLAPCEKLCARWSDMLGCLANICLRRHELSQKLRDRFDTLFSSRVSAVATIVFNGIPSNPFASDVFSTTCWTVVRLVQEFDWLCTPYAVWPQGMEKSLGAALADFVGAYTTYMNELAAAGITICAQKPDPCERLRRLTDTYRTICETTPNAASGPIIAITAALTRFAPWIPGIQRQLALPAVAYPSGAVFCDRLYFAIKLVGTAYARYNELSVRHRMAVDVFDAIVRRQGEVYSWGIGDQLPRPVTDMSDYRAQWMELLLCVCRACEWIGTLSSGERTTYATIVTMVESPSSALHQTILDLHTKVITLATPAGLPIVIDPCADTICEKLRIVINFFTLYCLRCQAPESSVVTSLEGHLDALRAAVVDLRSALMLAGRSVCAEENLEPVVLQSPSLYVQAAGSTGSDGSAQGVHLRWALLNELGDHLPKGNLARPGTTNYGTNPFNKKDDFVKIYRAPYRPSDRFVAEIDLTATAPTRFAGDNSVGIEWIYENVIVDQRFNDVRTTITVALDANAYPAAFLPLPTTPTPAYIQGVLNAYNGLFHVSAGPKLLFACTVALQNGAAANATVRFEAISRNDDPAVEESEFITCRQEVSSSVNSYRIESENVETVLIKTLNGKLRKVMVETYDDFYVGTKRRYLWKKMGAYGLETDTVEVMRRLEDTAHFTIDGNWPKYETLTSDGSGRTLVKNYADRWIPTTEFGRHADQSIRATLLRYLDKSKSRDNIEAWVDQDVVTSGQKTVLNISLLHMLLLAAHDYHIARMLGLGTIDWQVPLSSDPSDQRYVYFAEYEAAPAQGATESPTTHRFLTLPTGRADERLPVVPEIESAQFGLDPEFTDTLGYTYYGGSRFIRLYKKDLAFDLPVEGFFATSARFSRGANTRPVLFGIKYGAVSGLPGSETIAWSFPDPSNDDAEFVSQGFKPYRDLAGKPEISPIPDPKDLDGVKQPLFTHLVENRPEHAGKHIYGVYGINWFGRPSTFSPGPTVVNNFPVRNTLQPPSNLAVQYILDEDPPIFISESERDPAYLRKTRVTFDWNNAHEEAYHRANAVDLYFRPTDPLRIRGAVASVGDSATWADAVEIHTTSYQDTSKETPETIAPTIAPSELVKYVGSHFVTSSSKFQVLQVQRDGSGKAIFTVAKLPVLGSDGAAIPDLWTTPRVEDIFLVVENIMGADEVSGYMAGWQRLTSHRIQLVDFTQPPFSQNASYEERVVNGKTVQIFVGGMTSAAGSIVKVSGAGLDGVYEVTLPSPLPAYSAQFPGVTWVDFYKGTARVRRSDGTIGTFDVLRIDLDVRNTMTKFFIYDRDNSVASLEASPGAVWVNFHPGYRAYINWAQEGSPYGLIEPAFPEMSHLTYMAAKSVDTTHTSNSQPYRSALTPPAVHLARLQVQAQTPQKPSGPLFASRPDVYGKSSYMLDMGIDSGRAYPPYGLIFFRADELAILSALYKQSTIRDTILPGLPPSDDDPQLWARWNGLLDVNVDASEFKTYGSSPFKFPWPDRALDGNDNGRFPEFDGQHAPDAIASRIRQAIYEAFLPLTETYVPYDLVRNDSLQTSNAKPVTRRPDGQPYEPGDPLFDPFPMVRRGFVDGNVPIVRFGDYTLDGASRNIYFYYVRELGNDMKFSDLKLDQPTTIWGPVRLINTTPPAAPQIKSVRVSGANPALRKRASVTITFNRYLPQERIVKAVIYRTTNAAEAIAIRNMTAVTTVDLPLVVPDDGVYTVRDTFADLTQQNQPIPYGGPIYYRIVVQRQVPNERGGFDLVASEPSEPVVVNIMDTVNPPAPVIKTIPSPTVVYVDPPNDMRVQKLTNVQLVWSDNVYNSTHTLYKLSSSGQWVKVQTFPPQVGRSSISHSVGELPKLAEDGSEIFHRFKVMVINSSGLANAREEVLTL